jgi:hypothetical protein
LKTNHHRAGRDPETIPPPRRSGLIPQRLMPFPFLMHQKVDLGIGQK